MPRKYYAYGTYSENGKLYTKDGKEIKNPEKYYEVCRKNFKKNKASSLSKSKINYKKRNDYSYYGDDDEKEYYNAMEYVNSRERENAYNASREFGIEGVDYMCDEEYELVELGYLTDDDY